MKIKLGELRNLIRQISEAANPTEKEKELFGDEEETLDLMDRLQATKSNKPKTQFDEADGDSDSDEWSDVFSEYSDVYKEKNNIRPRWITKETTSLEKLKQMLEDLYNEPSTFDKEYGY